VSDSSVNALANRVAGLPPAKQVDVLLGMLVKVTAERDRLRAVVDVADDFWPLIESIYDGAVASWEYEDPRMKYVTVQISKVDLPTLHAACVDTGGDT
jgi:hypothetical protein